jgi:uncharacterized protein YkwD
MPRTLFQGIAFLIGFWIALAVSPLTVELARADDAAETQFTDLETRLLAEVNAVRARYHLIPLRRSPDLDRVAIRHSVDMARRNYMSHHSPEGTNPVDRITRSGLSGFTLAAENLGKTNRPDPNREIIDNWLASPDHRRNLLTPPFNTTGIGIARAPNGSLIYTQVYVTFPR